MKTSSLKRRFIIFAIIIIIPIATSNIISLIIGRKINENYNSMQSKMSTTNEIKGLINDSFNYFNQYIQNNSLDSKKLYDDSYNKALNNVKMLQSNSDLNSRYILRDLLNSLNTFKDSGDGTIKKYDLHGGIDTYYSDYLATKEFLSYCSTFISKLSDSYLTYNNEVYAGLKDKEKYIYKILSIYIITAVLISII
ncbi:MAG: sensor histidine kinase, partial [Bacillota bacterium]|nr:sensor histidine kinase [Bacillota bacterium]